MPATRVFYRSVLSAWAIVLFFFGAAHAQSTDIGFPTPVGANRIKGEIAARDLGDARLTTHYYFFDGTQGDIVIRAATENFDGDIDVFNAQGLRPITKMSFISGTSLTESAREIYLRKAERLILRVEGRSSGDEAATYSITLEGSFKPIAGNVSETPEAPRVKTETEGSVRVNSVGTIIEPKRTEKETVPEILPESAETRAEGKPPENAESKAVTPAREEAKTETSVKQAPARTATRRTTPARRAGTAARRTTAPPATAKKTAPPKAETPDPLADVRFVVVKKDGETFEHPINQVQRFSVERGVLTVIMKTGAIVRIPVKDIQRMTVE